MQRTTPCLWFDRQAEEAANFYVSDFPNSRILDLKRHGEGSPMPADAALTVRFELEDFPPSKGVERFKRMCVG